MTKMSVQRRGLRLPGNQTGILPNQNTSVWWDRYEQL